MARPGQCISVGTLPQLIAFALDFFYIPDSIKAIIMSYFQDMHTAAEVGIAMGCAISPILFVAALKVILIGARQVVGGVRLPIGQRLPPLRSYMDDITCLLQTAPCIQTPKEAGRSQGVFACEKGRGRIRPSLPLAEKSCLHCRPINLKSGKVIYIQCLRQGDGRSHPPAAFSRSVKHRLKPATRKGKEGPFCF